MQKLYNILISLVKAGLINVPYQGESLDMLTEDEMGELINIASKSDVLQIVSDVIIRDCLVSDDELKEIFKLSAKSAFMRNEKTLYEYNALTKALEEAGIPFMPLKGSVIRSLYPKDWYRTSCDIDILIKEQDVARARTCVENTLGYTFDKQASHDISFVTKNNLRIELHFSLIEESSLHLGNKRRWNANILSSVWDDISVRDGWKCFCEMSPEKFYLYHIAHMAKHFEGGGCGLRSVCDLWLIQRTYDGNIQLRNDILKKCGLKNFSDFIIELSEVWFGDGDHTDITLFLENYIISGGVYGNVENNITYKQNKKGGKIAYVFYRVFMPYDVLKYIYPSLKKYKWLYPFFTVKRWTERLLFGGKVKKSLRELNALVENDDGASVTEILNKIGL